MISLFRRFTTVLALVLLPTSAFGGSNLIMLSGGPAIYDPKDPDHDKFWGNYVYPPVLMADAATLKPSPGQEVWWFVYKPAYTARWADDLTATDFRKNHVAEVRSRDHSSYVKQIEAYASDRKWKLQWIDSAKDFWSRMGTFRDPVDKFYYWGHARDDLWLTARHNQRHEVIQPVDEAIIAVSEISKRSELQVRFTSGKKLRNEFWGCNTSRFTEEWNKIMKTPTMGFQGVITFGSIIPDKGVPKQSPGCIRKEYP